MLHYFNEFDYAIIIVYFCALIGLGFYLQKKASASIEDYFLGGRQIPWYYLGVSGMAWSLDITGTMLIVSFLYLLGPRGLFIEFRGGANLILIFMMLWTGKWHRRSGCITVAEWTIFRYGNNGLGQAARFMTAIAMIAFIVGMIGYLVRGVGIFLSTFLPLTPFECSLLLVTVATIYTIASGFYGVVFTDIIQAGIILIAVIAVTTMAALMLNDHPGTLAGLAESVTGSANWTTSIPQWEVDLPAGYESQRLLIIVSLFYLLRVTMAGFGSGEDQRYFGARNDRECGLLTFLWSNLMMFRWPMMISFAVLGIFLINDLFPDQAVLDEAAAIVKEHVGEVPEGAWSDTVADIAQNPEQYPELAQRLDNTFAGDWTRKLPLVGYHGTVNPEKILPSVLLYRIPPGFRGLLFVALIAASMSTFDSHLNKATSFWTRDFYQGFFRPQASNRELMYASYIFGIVLVVLGFLLGYASKNINHIWDWVNMGLGAGIALPLILRMYWWRFNAGGAIIGFFVGLVTAVAQHALYPDLGPVQKFSLVTAASLTGCIVGTYLTPPTPREVLENFYKITRPFGFWGPFKQTLAPDLRAATHREHFYDILSVPFALGYLVTLFLMPMQLVIRNWTAFAVTLPIWLTCALGLYLFWYRKLPAANQT